MPIVLLWDRFWSYVKCHKGAGTNYLKPRNRDREQINTANIPSLSGTIFGISETSIKNICWRFNALAVIAWLIKLCFHFSYLFSWFSYITPRNWALLEKSPVTQLLKSFPIFYGTRKFITEFTRTLHLSIFLSRQIQPILPFPTSIRSILTSFTCMNTFQPRRYTAWATDSAL
jgi:hypothetical protein